MKLCSPYFRHQIFIMVPQHIPTSQNTTMGFDSNNSKHFGICQRQVPTIDMHSITPLCRARLFPRWPLLSFLLPRFEGNLPDQQFNTNLSNSNQILPPKITIVPYFSFEANPSWKTDWNALKMKKDGFHCKWFPPHTRRFVALSNPTIQNTRIHVSCNKAEMILNLVIIISTQELFDCKKYVFNGIFGDRSIFMTNPSLAHKRLAWKTLLQLYNLTTCQSCFVQLGQSRPTAGKA